MNNLWIIFWVLLASGAVGGVINFFIADPQSERQLSWWQHLVVGIGAAFMVPLFLNMISSGLIDSIRGTGNSAADYSKLFVLAGFCLVAAVSSRAFIRTIAERLLQEVRTAKKSAEEAKEDAGFARAAVAPFVEEDAEEGPGGGDGGGPLVIKERVDEAPTIELTEDEHSVLRTMTTSAYTMRSMSGIAKETGLEQRKVNSAITSMMNTGFIAQTQSTEGRPRWWYATSLGRELASKHSVGKAGPKGAG